MKVDSSIRIGILALALLVSLVLMRLGDFCFLLCVFIVAAPITLNAWSRRTIRKRYDNNHRKREYFGKRIRETRAAGYAADLFVSFFLALAMLPTLYLVSLADLLVIAMLVPGIIILSAFLEKHSAYKSVFSGALTMSRKQIAFWLSSAIVYVILWLAFSGLMPDAPSVFGSVEDLYRSNIAYTIGLFVDLLSDMTASFLAMKSIGRFLVIIMVNGSLLYYTCYRYFEAALIPADKLLEVFTPIECTPLWSDEEEMYHQSRF